MVDGLEGLRAPLDDDRDEMDDGIDPLDRTPDRVRVRDDSREDLDPGGDPAGAATEHADLESLASQPRNEMASDEARTACDQDLHPDPSLLGRTGLRARPASRHYTWRDVAQDIGSDRRIASLVGGRYQITGLIASGGMGEVFQAHDRVLDRTRRAEGPPRRRSARTPTSSSASARKRPSPAVSRIRTSSRSTTSAAARTARRTWRWSSSTDRTCARS